MQTRDQEYASRIRAQVTNIATAAAHAAQVAEHSGHQQDITAAEAAKARLAKYGGMAHKLPILIRTAGLAQALAFVETRGEPGLQQLLDDLAQVTIQGTGARLVARSRDAELQEYMQLSQRAMAALAWYKRFAQSVLHITTTADEEQGVDV